MSTRENLKYVGHSILRLDGEDKVRGTKNYIADEGRSGMLHAHLVVSETAHGKIIDIDTGAAMKLDGVINIYTPSDVPPVLYNTHNWLPDMNEFNDEALLTDTPKHHGDRIAIVVATSAEIARKAASLVRTTFEPLPVICSIDDALAPASKPIHPYGNVPFDIVKEYGTLEEAMKKAYLVVEDTIETAAQHHGAIEPHACIAYPEDDSLVIRTPCQITFQVQMLAALVTGLRLSNIRVVKTVTGGSFGGKSQPVLEPVCAFLAHDLKRPVRLVMDRKQSILSTRRRNNTRGHVSLAVSADGRMFGRKLDVVADTGAYYGNGTAVCMAMLKKAMRLYRFDSQQYRARSVVTNTPVAGAARGYGSPQIHAITEINIENAARLLGIDPLAFRLRNIMQTGDSDPLGSPGLGKVGVGECLVQGAERFGWKEKYAAHPGDGRYRTGVGMAAMVHGNGYYGAYPESSTVHLSLLADGSITVDAALHDLGCGTITVAHQIAAEALRVPISSVRVLEADTLRSPYDPVGSQACRVTFVCGEAIRQASEAFSAAILERAARIMGVQSSSLQMDGETVVCIGSGERMTLAEVSRRGIRNNLGPLQYIYHYDADANPGSYGATFAEVVVDTWTGLVDVRHIVAAHDIGRALNPEFVRGQIYGGVQMNLGFALYEDMSPSSDGTIRGSSFSKYHMINAPSMPQIDIVLVEAEEPHGPYGAKSIGEPSAVAAAPATINAINHALGTRISRLPASPERIIEALYTSQPAIPKV